MDDKPKTTTKQLTQEEQIHQGLKLGPWLVDATDWGEWMIKGQDREIIQYVGMGPAARARACVIVAAHNLELKQTREELKEARMALCAYRSALRSGERESRQLRDLADISLDSSEDSSRTETS